MRADDLDVVKAKLYSESEPFLAAHPKYDLSLLPSWVAENIEVARVYGNSKKGGILPDGRKYHLDNHLNDLTGREWTFFIDSVFFTHYPTSGKESYDHHMKKIHPTPKSPQPSKKETNLLHSDVVNELNKIPNLYYKGMKIWADESTKLYP